MESHKNVGSCCRSLKSGQVLERDQASRFICGSEEDCESSSVCKKIFSTFLECAPVSSGVTLHKNVQLGTSLSVDVVLIPEGENLRTLVVPLNNATDIETSKIEFLEKHGLTKSETKIMLEVFKGKRNQEIADMLFISKATLKTHLNNIYKKLPEIFRPTQKRDKTI